MIKGRSGGSSSRTSINSSNPADPMAWYDNEWAYSCKCIELMQHMKQTP